MAVKSSGKKGTPLKVYGGAGIEIGFLLGEDDLFYEIGEGVFGTFLLSKGFKATKDEEKMVLEKPVADILQDMPVYSNRGEFIGRIRYVVASEELLDSFIIEEVESPPVSSDDDMYEEGFRDEEPLPEDGKLTEGSSAGHQEEQKEQDKEEAGVEEKKESKTEGTAMPAETAGKGSEGEDEIRDESSGTGGEGKDNSEGKEEKETDTPRETKTHGRLITLLLEDIWRVETSRVVLQKTKEEVFFHQEKHGIGEHIAHFIREHFG